MPGFLEFQSLHLCLVCESHLFLRLLSGAGVDSNSIIILFVRLCCQEMIVFEVDNLPVSCFAGFLSFSFSFQRHDFFDGNVAMTFTT